MKQIESILNQMDNSLQEAESRSKLINLQTVMAPDINSSSLLLQYGRVYYTADFILCEHAEVCLFVEFQK